MPCDKAVNVFVSGGDGAIYRKTLIDRRWDGWRRPRPDGDVGSDGRVAPRAPELLRHRRPGVDNATWSQTWVPGAGSGWSSLGGNSSSGPALNSQLDGHVNVFARAPALDVVRRFSHKRRARVSRSVFFTKGKGRAVRVDRKAPCVVRIKINGPAGSIGRVDARVYYRRSARGKLHRKTVSRRYVVCR